MNRLGMLGGVVFLCGMLAGCGSETRSGLITDTIQRMNQASSKVGLIATKVKEATDEATKENKALNLSKAAEAADELKKTGVEIVQIKQRIDLVRGTITDSEKEEYAKEQQESLNKAFKSLLQSQQDLRDAMAAAEKIDKTKTDELHKKIVDAISPFEAQTKVSGPKLAAIPTQESPMNRCAGSVGILLASLAFLSAGEESSHEKVIQQMIGSAESIGVTLKTIIDEDSAAAAKPDLRKAAVTWIEARARGEKLQPPEKEEKARLEKLYKPKLKDALEKMFTQVRRVENIPGGKEALKEIRGVLKKDGK